RGRGWPPFSGYRPQAQKAIVDQDTQHDDCRTESDVLEPGAEDEREGEPRGQQLIVAAQFPGGLAEATFAIDRPARRYRSKVNRRIAGVAIRTASSSQRLAGGADIMRQCPGVRFGCVVFFN